MASEKRCNTLTLKSKIDVIKCHDEHRMSVKVLAEKFNCGKTQVYQILKSRDKIKCEWLNGNYSSGIRRKPRKTGNEGVNKILYRWYVDARAHNLPISGPILKEQAKRIAQRLGRNDFGASNGWLESFRSRHEISFKTARGEGENVDDWKKKLELIKDYDPHNVANCDETEMFFEALPHPPEIYNISIIDDDGDRPIVESKHNTKEETFIEETFVNDITFAEDPLADYSNAVDSAHDQSTLIENEDTVSLPIDRKPRRTYNFATRDEVLLKNRTGNPALRRPVFKNRTRDDSLEKTLAALKDVLQKEGFNQVSNEFVAFGNSVGMQLQQMPLEIAIQTQTDIQSIISNARLRHIRMNSSN